jgi:hypothetical protein
MPRPKRLRPRRVNSRWKSLSESERLECLKRYIEFNRTRTKISARWLLISHIQWNKWCGTFNAPPIPLALTPRFYQWLADLCERSGLREGLEYKLAFRQRHQRERVKGLLIQYEALSRLLSLAPIAGVQTA